MLVSSGKRSPALVPGKDYFAWHLCYLKDRSHLEDLAGMEYSSDFSKLCLLRYLGRKLPILLLHLLPSSRTNSVFLILYKTHMHQIYRKPSYPKTHREQVHKVHMRLRSNPPTVPILYDRVYKSNVYNHLDYEYDFLLG